MVWKFVTIIYTNKAKVNKKGLPVCPDLIKTLKKDTLQNIVSSVTNPTKKSRAAFLKDPFVRGLWEIFVERATKKNCFQRQDENTNYGTDVFRRVQTDL
jgi:hypothetical protein